MFINKQQHGDEEALPRDSTSKDTTLIVQDNIEDEHDQLTREMEI